MRKNHHYKSGKCKYRVKYLYIKQEIHVQYNSCTLTVQYMYTIVQCT